jgi:hypothetical protein
MRTRFLDAGASSFSVILVIIAAACHPRQPSIVFTKVPAAAEGTPYRTERIEGRVTGAKPGQRVVLYAKSGVWWVQPLVERPFTAIQSDSTWHSTTHPGTEFAALLVDSNFSPPLTTQNLPAQGGAVAAVATVKGAGATPVEPPPKVTRFSGYDWEVRKQPENGGMFPFDPANVWVDADGCLHLRTTRQADGSWIGGEARLTHSLGQGLYRFTVRDLSRIDPSSGLTLFTWDDLAGDQQHRDLEMQVGRLGNPANTNAAFVVYPSEEPANVFRYEIPQGLLTYSFRWEPGKVSFKTVRGSATVAAHDFTSGVPSSGGERVNISVFVTAGSPIASGQKTGVEAVIEKFEYLP